MIQQANPKEITKLRIYKNESFAGTLERTSTGCRLSFDGSFLQNSKNNELAYCIKKSNSPLHTYGTNLPPFFAGLLPEGLRFKTLIRAIKTSEDDLFSLFAATGSQCIGDVYAKETILPPELAKPSLHEIDFYRFFNLLCKIPYGFSEESIAGVQEKISASMINFPFHIAKKKLAYILKLNPKEYPNLIENEFQCLQIAKKCGIPTNNARIIYDKNKNSGLLIERFDRYFDCEEYKLKMIHQEDACQFMNLYPADKYRISINQIAETMRSITTAPPLEVLKLIRLYSFSYLLGNGDLHAKNISLFTHPKTQRIEMTLVYDLICTFIYGDKKMALKLDGRDDNFKLKHIVEFAKRFDIPEKACVSMIQKLLYNFQKQALHLFSLPLDKKQSLALKKMIEKRIADMKSLK